MYLYDDYLSFCIYVLYLIILLTLNDNDNESNNNTNNTYIDNIIIVIFYLITLFHTQLIEFLSTKTAWFWSARSEWKKMNACTNPKLLFQVQLHKFNCKESIPITARNQQQPGWKSSRAFFADSWSFFITNLFVRT